MNIRSLFGREIEIDYKNGTSFVAVSSDYWYWHGQYFIEDDKGNIALHRLAPAFFRKTSVKSTHNYSLAK